MYKTFLVAKDKKTEDMQVVFNTTAPQNQRTYSIYLKL